VHIFTFKERMISDQEKRILEILEIIVSTFHTCFVPGTVLNVKNTEISKHSPIFKDPTI